MIDREEVGGVTVLRLAHGKANTLDFELCQAIQGELAQLARAARPVVLTGAGPMFSAGVDLFRAVEGGAPYLEKFVPALSGAFDAVFRYPGPVVAAVNGHAIAGGCILACCADLRIMADGGARIGVPELSVGVPFPAVALEALRFATGDAGIQELVYGGGTYEGPEAHRRRLVDELVAGEQVLGRALVRAGELGAIPAGTFTHTKRHLRAGVLERLDRATVDWDTDMVRLWTSPEVMAAVEAYVERTIGGRRPVT